MEERLTDEIRIQEAGAGGSKNLLVNYISLLGGTVIAKGLALLTVLMLTRYLGVQDFGRYSLIFSFWALMNTLVDFGSAQILGRDIARDPARMRKSVETAIYLRLLCCVIFLPLGYFLAHSLAVDTRLYWLVVLGIFTGFEAYYDIYFSATMQLDKNAKARYFASIGNLVLVALAIILHWPFIVIILLGMLNPLVKLVYDRRFAGRMSWKLHGPDWPRIGRMARDGWPLWLAGIQFIILARIDTFMLQVLTPSGGGEWELGIYSAAYRFSEVMSLLIGALSPSLLPLLVANMDKPERIRFLAGTSTRLVLAVVMVMSLFVFWYAHWIVRLYGPGYGPSAACMKILIWSQALVAVNGLVYQLLVIYNVQGRKPVIISGAAMTLVNIGLNFWLIPILRAEGASLATVITEFLIALSMLWFLRRYTPLRLGLDVLVMEGLALLACVPAWLLAMQGGVLSLLAGLIAMLAMVGLVLALRLLTLKDLRTLAAERISSQDTQISR